MRGGLRHPFANAFIYGLLYGPLALPCARPWVVGIFALSLTVAEAVGWLNTFPWFGLPLLALSLLSGSAQQGLTRLFARHARRINLTGGLLLVGIGLYDLWLNRELRLAFLA